MINQKKTIYERLGQSMAIDFTVDKLLQKLQNDPKLKSFFVKTDMKKLNSQMQAFLTMLFGGPSNYTGRDMLEAHRGLGIDDTHFNLVVKHLSDTLVNLALPEDIVAEVVEVCESLRDDVQMIIQFILYLGKDEQYQLNKLLLLQMANSQKCSNCGGKDHIAKFCYERTKKVPATVKLSTQSDKMNSKEKKELKLQKKEQEIVVQVTKQTPKSKYEEDKYIGQHTQIWGSYWNEVLGWGFACCYSNQKSQECLGEKGKRQSLTKEYSIKRQIEETPIAQQELKSGPLNLDELYRKSNLREGAPVDVIYNQSNTIDLSVYTSILIDLTEGICVTGQIVLIQYLLNNIKFYNSLVSIDI